MKIGFKHFILVSITLLFYNLSFSEINVDSTFSFLISQKEDSSQINKLIDLAWKSRLTNTDQAIKIANKSLQLSTKLEYKKGIYRSYMILGHLQKDLSEFDKSLALYFEALKISESILVKDSSFTNLDFKSSTLTNIGEIYIEIGDFKKAEEYLMQSKHIDSLNNNTIGLATVFFDLGNLAFYKSDYYLAINYYTDYLNVQEKLNDLKGLVLGNNNIGFAYEYLQDYKKALNYYLKANKISYEYGSENLIAATLTNVGSAYGYLNQKEKCIINLNNALTVALKIKSSSRIGDVYECFYNFYSSQQDYKNALKYQLLLAKEKEKIFNTTRTKQIAEMETKYQSQKKDNEIQLLNKEKEKTKAIALAEQKKKNTIIISITFGLLIVLVFSYFLYKRFKVTKSQKLVIENQKKIVEQKNKDITDSINYAKKIQTALLKEEEYVSKNLPPHFILFQPKDIVSGDFYWAAHKENYLYLACTCFR